MRCYVVPVDTPSIEAAIRALVAEELGTSVDSLPADAKLTEIGLPSMKLLRVVAQLEQRYEVELDDDVLFGIETLGQLAEAIAARRR